MNNSNPVSSQDVTYLSMSMASFAAAAASLSAKDYVVAGGMLVLGIVLTYLYHRFGSPSVPEGTLPVTVPNPTTSPIATPTTNTTVTTTTPAPTDTVVPPQV